VRTERAPLAPQEQAPAPPLILPAGGTPITEAAQS